TIGTVTGANPPRMLGAGTEDPAASAAPTLTVKSTGLVFVVFANKPQFCNLKSAFKPPWSMTQRRPLPDLADVGIPQVTADRADRPRPLVEGQTAGCMADFFEERADQQGQPFCMDCFQPSVCSWHKN